MMIYEQLHTPVGVKVEHIYGDEELSRRVWRIMAGQIWSENGRGGYRTLGHFANGAPCTDEPERISLSHTGRMMVVASLPRTPEQPEMGCYSERTALGVDVENTDRSQVLKVRGRFLDEAEQQMIAPDDVAANILAWTAKEAVYKAMLQEKLSLAEGIEILRLPQIQPQVEKEVSADALGEAIAMGELGNKEYFRLYSYMVNDMIVTLAVGHKAATFRKSVK